MIVFIFFFGLIQAQTGALKDAASDLAKTLQIRVWAAPAEQKIRPDDGIESENLIWSGTEKRVSVAGAANEHIPFQLVVSTNVKGSPRKIKPENGFFVEVSDLVSENHRIPGEEIKLYVEHYIMLFAKSSPVGATGYWPDALAPMKVPFDMEAHYDVVRNRPLWIDLFVPKDTRGGKYAGTIKVTQHGKILETITLDLEVYDFALPDETPLITYMNVSKEELANFYRKEGEELDDLTMAYYELLYANRMEPWFNDMLRPKIRVTGDRVEVDFDDERYLYFMNQLKTKRVLLEAFPGSLRRQIDEDRFSEGFNRIVKSYLSQVDEYFRKNGWQGKLVFNSPVDEPRSLKEYEDTRKWASLVKEATSDVPFLITRTPVPPKNHPEWGSFKGYVDHYSIHGNHLNDPELRNVAPEVKHDGGELTWYISCDQKYPQPNYFIDAPAMDLVMVPWITARYKLDGILYWGMNFWSQTANPWLNANTFHSGFLCSGGWILNGEGSLFYPGNYTKSYTGQPNVKAAVSSMRFELLREGIEDYLYLSMLEDLGDEEFAQEQLDQLVIDVKAFSRKAAQLYAVRKAMAKRLEELTR